MSDFKSGYVSIIGVPNAGKSSLVNALVKESVSIVTAKPQTTRKRTMGILTLKESFQIIFVDTPGVIESTTGLNGFLKREFEGALRDVDVIVCALAPWEFKTKDLPWALNARSQFKSPVIFIATQCDKKDVSETSLLERWQEWTLKAGEPTLELLLTSSRTNAGLETLKNKLVDFLKPGPLYYDVDTFTPQTMREMTTEVVRKYCFERLHQEIPYGIAVALQKFVEGPTIKIEADVIVTKDGHKGMVIGEGGKVLKQIGTLARTELEKMFGQKIFLKLHVVAKPWITNKNLMEELGYASR